MAALAHPCATRHRVVLTIGIFTRKVLDLGSKDENSGNITGLHGWVMAFFLPVLSCFLGGHQNTSHPSERKFILVILVVVGRAHLGMSTGRVSHFGGATEER